MHECVRACLCLHANNTQHTPRRHSLMSHVCMLKGMVARARVHTRTRTVLHAMHLCTGVHRIYLYRSLRALIEDGPHLGASPHDLIWGSNITI